MKMTLDRTISPIDLYYIREDKHTRGDAYIMIPTT